MGKKITEKEINLNVALLDTFKKNEKIDYIDCFLPLLAVVLRDGILSDIEPESIKEAFEKELEIEFPVTAIKSILKRAVKRGLLEKHEGNYLKNDSEISLYSEKYTKNKNQIVADQNLIANEFIEFAFKKFGRQFDEDGFFVSFNKFLKENIIDILGQNYRPEIQGKSTNNMNYIISCFLKSSWEEGVGFPSTIQRIIKGYLLSNYLCNSSVNMSDNIKRFKVFLDTPLIIAALGFNGSSKERYVKELLNGLKVVGAKIYVLDINEEELRGIFSSWIHDLKNNNYKKFKPHTLKLFKNSGIDEIYLEKELTLLDSRLAGLGIQKMDSPPFKRDFQLDEEQLKSLLVQEGFEEFRASTDRDVGCVSSINRFRKGKEVYTSSKEIHIFLTKNPTLNRVANNFFLNEKLSSQNSVPPLMSESIIASLLFANNSVDFESLGPKLVLSHAYSVIFTDDKFMEKYSERLDSLLKREIITEDQYILYRYDHELRSFINNYRVTNDLEELDEDGFAEMFRKIKEREKRIIEEKSEAYENQIREIKKDTTREKDRNRQLSQNNTEMKKENKKLKEEQSMLVDKTARQEKFINFILASFVFVALIGLNITIESLSEAYKKSGYSNFVIPVYAVGSIIIYIKGVPFFKIVTFIKKKLKID